MTDQEKNTVVTLSVLTFMRSMKAAYACAGQDSPAAFLQTVEHMGVNVQNEIARTLIEHLSVEDLALMAANSIGLEVANVVKLLMVQNLLGGDDRAEALFASAAKYCSEKLGREVEV